MLDVDGIASDRSGGRRMRGGHSGPVNAGAGPGLANVGRELREFDQIRRGGTICLRVALPSFPTTAIVDQQTPVALFASIEDAMDWALTRYKGGSFRLRYEPVAVIERESPAALSS